MLQCIYIYKNSAQYIEVERNIYGRKKHINYKFIPTSLFRGRPLIRGFEKMKHVTRLYIYIYIYK